MQREGEREREREMYIYIYIYILFPMDARSPPLEIRSLPESNPS